MKVSIICATWNRADTLHIPIESCLAQTYEDWDLWIMDDASTDNTEEVVGKYSDPRIHYVKLEKQPYYTVVRNKGIEASGGELLVFRDSDSGMAPDFLEKLVKPHKAKDVTMSYCGRLNFKGIDMTTLKYEDIEDLVPALITMPSHYTGKESLSDKIDVGDMMIKRSTGVIFTDKKDQPGYCSDARMVDEIEQKNPMGRFVRINEPLHFYFYQHGSDTINMTDQKIADREEGKFDTDFETPWQY